MEHPARVAWVAGLTDRQVVAQAAVRARASDRSVTDILGAWTLNGLLAYDRKNALAHALRGLAGITPASFYALAEAEPARARLALALLDDAERYVFALACADYLSALYAYRVDAAIVAEAWRRAGLLEG